MVQQANELGIGLCLISEPPTARDTQQRHNSGNGLASILCWPDRMPNDRTGPLVKRGRNYVAVRVGDWLLVSCYASPNIVHGEYLEFLDELEELIRDKRAAEMIIGGDFNARSKTWNPRASIVKGP
ncbi:uncharacterized protein LOC116847546 [Odontomachus brunneus]|uniref:uncharacterized protein LOC116847546 n=1 Tax=Odontomachus brunneus TaxID=486640 RepID=UPI0013F2A0D3|nr:uncharacterized protein LOC116847546 [Odontomachus brunneus]